MLHARTLLKSSLIPLSFVYGWMHVNGGKPDLPFGEQEPAGDKALVSPQASVPVHASEG